MRWSLILSTSLTVLSTFSAALVIPSTESLERRGNGAKASSKTYRKNSEGHDYAYKFDQTGGVSRQKLPKADRPANGKKVIMIPKTDADHVFEHQMLNNHLAKHNLKYNDLHPKLKGDVKTILNNPKNMAPVPSKVNRGKGQVIKHGLEGKALKPNKSRDQYTLLSYKSARGTAKKLDKAFKDNGHDFKGNTFHKTLRNTMNSAKIMDSKNPSPKSSRRGSSVGTSSSASSSHGGSNHGIKAFPLKPKAVPVRKSKVSLPPRRSTRIAAAAAKGKAGK